MPTKIQPVAHRVLVKPDKLEEEQALEKEFQDLARMNFAVVKPNGQDRREKRAITTGTVVAIGPTAWKVFGDGSPWCAVGDKVEFARYAGELVYHPDTKEELFVMNDEDILLIHTKEE